jgi:hypothetical protein
MAQEQDRARAKLVSLQRLFEHEGWPVLMDEMRSEIEGIKEEMLTVPDWEKVNFHKGRVMQLLDMLYLEDTIANMLQMDEETPDANV